MLIVPIELVKVSDWKRDLQNWSGRSCQLVVAAHVNSPAVTLNKPPESHIKFQLYLVLAVFRVLAPEVSISATKNKTKPEQYKMYCSVCSTYTGVPILLTQDSCCSE